MQSGSYWAWHEASPSEMFGEPDEMDGVPAGAEEDSGPREWTCTTCGEMAPGCDCDRRAQDEALADARAQEVAACGGVQDCGACTGCVARQDAWDAEFNALAAPTPPADGGARHG